MPAPAWLDRRAYPFAPHYFEAEGGRMHYVDEGAGPAVVLVHGTPTWSFLYRRLVADLARDHRVIAPDHLGFGLSDKPPAGAYRPADHAARLAALVAHLGLERLTLVVHDYGGPIGLSYALDHASQVDAVVLFNTWLWPLDSEAWAARASRFLGGRLGRVLYTWLNFSPRFLLPAAFGRAAALTAALHRHYLAPFPSRDTRVAPWVLARELIASSDWYYDLWLSHRHLAPIPALLLWGMRDAAFSPKFLDRWIGVFTDAQVVRFPDAGHVVPEEAPDEVIEIVRGFLAGVERERARGR